MDFLDPRKRRTHNIRLMIGYVLSAIAIGLTATILVYGSYGYGINTKTGEIIQNGLLFVNSKPDGATIYLNGKAQGDNTAARLVLAAGNYELAIKKSGYRDWSRKFILDEHSVARFVYPLLWPLSLAPKPLTTYVSQPLLMSQSPDQRWLLVVAPAAKFDSLTIEQYDTGKLDQPAQTLVLPAGLLSNPSAAGSLQTIEWSNDNDHLLLQHIYPEGSEFIILNRANPASSLNINRAFGINPTQVALRNKKTDQLYIYTQNDATLLLADVAKATSQPILTNVLAFRAYGSDLLSYVTNQNVAAGQVMARIWQNGKTYPLYTFAAGNKYLLDIAQFQGHSYFVAGSDKADRLNIYKDPLDGLKDPSNAKAVPLIALRDSDASNLAFSTTGRFVGVQAAQRVGVYDIETKTRYQYSLEAPLKGVMHWMDGHRWLGQANEAIYVMDYDGTNQQQLVGTVSPESTFFDKNFNKMLTVASNGRGGVELQVIDLRAGTDLPKP